MPTNGISDKSASMPIPRFINGMQNRLSMVLAYLAGCRSRRMISCRSNGAGVLFMMYSLCDAVCRAAGQ